VGLDNAGKTTILYQLWVIDILFTWLGSLFILVVSNSLNNRIESLLPHAWASQNCYGENGHSIYTKHGNLFNIQCAVLSKTIDWDTVWKVSNVVINVKYTNCSTACFIWTCFVMQFNEWGGAHVSYDWQQCGRNSGEENPLPDVGYRWSGESPFLLEHILLQHWGNALIHYTAGSWTPLIRDDLTELKTSHERGLDYIIDFF